MLSTKILSSTSVFNIDNNASKPHIRMIYNIIHENSALIS